MTDAPVARVRETFFKPRKPDGSYAEDTIPAYRDVLVWCPGCECLHRFTTWVEPTYPRRANGDAHPVWAWNGSLTAPGFEPSMLAYYTRHLCENEHVYQECTDENFEACGHTSHGYAWVYPDGHQRTFKTYEEQPADVRVMMFGGESSPHTREPAFGNCHSFLRNGVWEFLADTTAHTLRGFHPVVPLPGHVFAPDDGVNA